MKQLFQNIFILLIFNISTIVNGQEVLLSSESFTEKVSEITRNSSLIIEGTIVFKKSLWNSDSTQIFTQTQILIKNIFKGYNLDSTVTIETLGGEIDGLTQFMVHEFEFIPTQNAYFFLSSKKNNKYLLDCQMFVPFEDNENNEKVICNGQELYRTEFENKIIKTTRISKAIYRKPLSNFEKFKSEDACDKLLAAKLPANIDFNFANAHYSTDLQYLEFDILAKVNTPGLRFGKGKIYINYSEQFGENVIFQKSVVVTKGTILENNIYNIAAKDFSEHTIVVDVTSEVASDSYYAFSADAEPILHFKIKIIDFSGLANISFEKINISGQAFYYCQNGYQPFNTIVWDQPIKAINPESGSEIGITYTFENPKTNSNNTQFSVDVFAVATASSKFDNGFIFVDYNNIGFGSSVVKNGTINVELDKSLFSDYDRYTSDVTSKQMQIVIVAKNDKFFFNLSTIKQKFLTLTFDIKDCDEDKKISFDEINMSGKGKSPNTISAYYTGIMPFPYAIYNPIIANDTENGKICQCSSPSIANFTPNTITAGTNSVLTINGNNFLDYYNTSSFVYFIDGDTGGGNKKNWMRAHPTDIVSWTDTEIKVKVPSVDALSVVKQPAASGNFKVSTKCGEVESNNPLTIPYAIMNQRVSGKAKKIVLKKLNDNGICFAFSTNIAPWVKVEVEEALKEWCPKTNISFFIQSSTSSKITQGVDQVNLIFAGQFSSSSTAGAAVIFTAETGNSPITEECKAGQEQGFYMKDIDIKIDQNVNNIAFPNSQDKINLRNNLKHEFGHAQMLNHAINLNVIGINKQPILYYSFTSTSIPPDIGIKPNDIDGAKQVFINSPLVLSTICGNPISPSTQCASSCSINTNTLVDKLLDDNINIYPNPSDGKISIGIKSSIFEETQGIITISDLSGKVIYSKQTGQIATLIQIELSLLPGIYFLNYKNKDRIFTRKIIIL